MAMALDLGLDLDLDLAGLFLVRAPRGWAGYTDWGGEEGGI